MTQRAVLIGAGLGFPALLLAFAWRGPAAAGIQAVLVTTLPVLLMAVGAARGGRLGPLALPLAGIWMALVAAALLVVALSGRPLVAGLPPAGWVLILGLAVAPLVLTSWAYAATFRLHGLREEDLTELPGPAVPPAGGPPTGER